MLGSLDVQSTGPNLWPKEKTNELERNTNKQNDNWQHFRVDKIV